MLLKFRIKQEKYHTLARAQEVVDRLLLLGPEEVAGLNRLARCHFGRSFQELVQECWDMLFFNLEQLNVYEENVLERPSVGADLRQ